MKEYYCIKDYIMEDGSVAYESGKTYNVTEEMEDGWFVFPSNFSKTHTMNTEDDFYDHFKEIKTFEGNFLDEFIGGIAVNGHEIVAPKDSIVESVVERFRERSEVGFSKYGTNLDRKDLSALEWLNHLQEELQDGILYAEKLKKEMQENKHTPYPLSKVTKVNIKSPIGNMSFGANEVTLNYSLDGKTVTLDII